MSLSVIVTRAAPGAQETAARLTREGYDAILSPVLEIVPVPVDPADFSDATDIVFTSANGVRAFADLGTSPAQRTAWCVGPSTAEAARSAGFGNVIAGAGNAEDLAALIIAEQARLRGTAWHIANTAAPGELVARLSAAGIAARFAAPYETRPVASLSAGASAALTSGNDVCVLVHSAKAAAALCVSASGRLGRASIVAISAAAASPLKGVPVGALAIAAQPNEDALFAALADAAARATG